MRPNALIHNFPALFGHLRYAEVGAPLRTACVYCMILSQDMCSYILLGDSRTGKIPRASYGDFPPPKRTLQRFRTQFQAQPSFGFDWYRVQYVAADRHGGMSFTRGTFIEISVFMAII